MTSIDYEYTSSFKVAGGKADFVTSADAILNELGKPGLPPCANIEILSVVIVDQNGNTFAVPGIYLPDIN